MVPSTIGGLMVAPVLMVVAASSVEFSGYFYDNGLQQTVMEEGLSAAEAQVKERKYI